LRKIARYVEHRSQKARDQVPNNRLSNHPVRRSARSLSWLETLASPVNLVRHFTVEHLHHPARSAQMTRRHCTTEALMARIPIEMPKLGYDMETGTIAAWIKKVGDTVARGDVLAEIETEKSTVEMEALAGGTLVEQTLAPGQEVPVGSVIGYLEDGQ
jgi:biotin carboxyl carrier protein